MLPPRPPGDTASQEVRPLGTPASEVHLPGSSSQLRSRMLGQDEHNVMLALGLVRTASRTLLALEPKLRRASELLLQLAPPREAATRLELAKVYDELSRAVAAATFDGRAMFDGDSAVFDVDDARRNGEPLTVALPDLDGLLHGERGVEGFLARARPRVEIEHMANTLRAAIADSNLTLREADDHLSLLLTHFHRHRREDVLPAPEEQDLALAATRLSERVLTAGNAALAAQGELSSRASSLVLHDDRNR